MTSAIGSAAQPAFKGGQHYKPLPKSILRYSKCVSCCNFWPVIGHPTLASERGRPRGRREEGGRVTWELLQLSSIPWDFFRQIILERKRRALNRIHQVLLRSSSWVSRELPLYRSSCVPGGSSSLLDWSSTWTWSTFERNSTLPSPNLALALHPTSWPSVSNLAWEGMQSTSSKLVKPWGLVKSGGWDVTVRISQSLGISQVLRISQVVRISQLLRIGQAMGITKTLRISQVLGISQAPWGLVKTV